MNKKIKSKVIEAIVLLETPKRRLMQFVMVSNSIDSVVLDLQELYPNEVIKRSSILRWKFLTVADYEKLQEEMKNPPMPNKEQNVQVSDTTEDK